MYLWDILIKNIGPVDTLRLTPRFVHPQILVPPPGWMRQPGQAGPVPEAYQGPRFVGAADLQMQRSLQSPQPILLVGPNGSGKSTVISIVADAMIELARQGFHDATKQDASGGHLYFRPLGSGVVAHGASHYLTAALFRDGTDDGRFVEYFGINQGNAVAVLGELQAGSPIHDWVVARVPQAEAAPSQPGAKVAEFSPDAATRAFRQSITAYFPASRFEDPIWLQGHAIEGRRAPKRRRQFLGKIPQNVFTETALDEVLVWVERLLADSRLPVVEDAGMPGSFQVQQGYNHGLVTLSIQLRDSVVSILRLVTGDANAQLLHTPRGAEELQVNVKNRQIPITALSTGEIGLLVIFLSLLMRTELRGKVASPASATGICIIDELDAHLHVSHQINVVPELISMFPQVQFIMTAHSPLVGLGLAKRLGTDGVLILDLPNGAPVDAEDHSEFRALFDAMEETTAFRQVVEAANVSLKQHGRPVVFVEGQTDRDYLELAANQLGKMAVWNAIEVQVGANGSSGDGAVSKIIDSAQSLQATGILARPTLGLCDFDLNGDGTPKQFREFEDNRVWKKRMPPPIMNHWWGHGVETLIALPRPDDLITEEPKIGKGGAPFTIPKLNKTALCERLKADPALADFTAFAPILDLIERFLATAGNQHPQVAQ